MLPFTKLTYTECESNCVKYFSWFLFCRLDFLRNDEHVFKPINQGQGLQCSATKNWFAVHFHFITRALALREELRFTERAVRIKFYADLEFDHFDVNLVLWWRINIWILVLDFGHGFYFRSDQTKRVEP